MHRLLASVWAVGLAVSAGMLHAQSQPTPGAPSQPFTAAAQAQNGGAGPQVTYQYGMEFVTIPGGGNAYPGITGGDMQWSGRGAVSADYRISRYEVGAASWSAFFNAANTVAQQTGQPIPYLTTPGGLSGSGQYGRVGNISWRTAAIYANWLCNGQALTRAAFLNGAYDVSTFGNVGNGFTDQLTHNPGAAFWIPTLDEWIRAAHWDPNHTTGTTPGWWQFAVTSDTHPQPGLPQWGADVNAGFSTQNSAEFAVLLGAYPPIQSPWGLYDTIGQTTEWLEEPFYDFVGEPPTGRDHAGAYLTGSPSDVAFGRLGQSIGQYDPRDSAYWMGFRIAAVVPTPSTLVMIAPLGVFGARRKRS